MDSVDDLREWLAAQGVPYDTWGRDGTKSVRRLWEEIAAGETWLSSGPPLREVAVVSVTIETAGRRLTEVRQLMADGAVRERDSPPTEKMLPGETPEAAALRCIAEELGVDPDAVTITARAPFPTVEQSDSPSYPGLPSRYHLHTVTAEVPGLPLTPFTTEEAPGHGDAAVRTHYWEWR
ncbi:NUDIX hydrolase [Streptomyces cylindrosporus]|uniref:NUDIX hydrolase n=1 Tax=Streptomyces cylindrosporus TaxID=2927583 RepID=A0ABS9YKJ6_9ACTN|nr:NUDIX hydrolase [Streptomyces cylindrosporus]MCI3277772.1 NUDIX hydrolase [Streptomyces cylindrosporus]